MEPEPVLMLVVGALLVNAAWSDFTRLRIPNRIPVLIAALFPVSLLLSDADWQSAAFDHLGAGALVLALGFGLFTEGKVGGGDAKLMASVSVWLGMPMLPAGLATAAVCGSVLSFAVFSLRRTRLPRWCARRGLASRALQPGRSTPYAVAIAAAFLWLQYHHG
jgi:prepilin peptidase CpaA